MLSKAIILSLLFTACNINLTPAGPHDAKKANDWSTICIKAESKKVSVKNVSAQSGYPIITVAMSVCSQKYVLDCYKRGICK